MKTTVISSKVFENINLNYVEREKRAIELRKEGRKVIGYFCCYTPVEMLTALNIVPYRIRGCISEPITQADSYFESVSCPFIRSCLDQALKGRYNFLDGIIVPHTCDTVHRIYDIWRYYIPCEYQFFFNVPHMMNKSSQIFFLSELKSLAKSLEVYTGKHLNKTQLLASIDMHNRNRALLKELYSLRKKKNPPISGSEALKAVLIGMGVPVSEHNEMLQELLWELKETKDDHSSGNKPRLLLYGSEIDDISLLKLIESCGADIVMDDLCTGSRCFWSTVNNANEPLINLAKHYLYDINCPRTYKSKEETRTADLRNRFNYILDFIHDYSVDGVIIYTIRYCDTFELEAPDIMEFLKAENIPVLYLEDDYTQLTSGQLRTRVQAFLEMIG